MTSAVQVISAEGEVDFRLETERLLLKRPQYLLYKGTNHAYVFKVNFFHKVILHHSHIILFKNLSSQCVIQ